MATAPTYPFYKDTYFGQQSEAAFKESLRTAINKVNYLIWPNEVTEDTEEAYQLAVCAAIDVDVAYGASGGIGETDGGFSIGSFSMSGQSGNVAASPSNYSQDMDRAIREQLIDTGLLYGGIA